MHKLKSLTRNTPNRTFLHETEYCVHESDISSNTIDSSYIPETAVLIKNKGVYETHYFMHYELFDLYIPSLMHATIIVTYPNWNDLHKTL